MADVRAESLTDTERAVLALAHPAEVFALFDSYAADALGSGIGTVRFRAGRIDVVWGVELTDGRTVALRGYRQPLDLGSLRATREAQGELAAAGFPCPEPLAGPDPVAGQVLAAETLLSGGALPDGHDPRHRRLLVEGLARHLGLLRDRRDLHDRLGPGPAWCRYHDGPWPTPHDPIVDFTSAR